MMTLASYTSDHACEQIAKRAIRENARDYLGPHDDVVRHVVPIAREYTSRKKLLRGELRPIAHKICAAMQGRRSIIMVRMHSQSPRLSPNERFVIHYVQTASTLASSIVRIITGRIVMTRRNLSMRMYDTGMTMNDHVLARYLRRAQMPVETLFANIGPTLRLALPLGAIAVMQDRREIAVPMGTGLLLGRVDTVPDKQGIDVIDFSVGTDGMSDPKAVVEPGPIPNARLAIDFRTFVDEGWLSPSQIALRDEIGAVYSAHGASIDGIFETIFFDGEDDVDEAASNGIKPAFSAIAQIVEGENWREFLNHRRAAHPW